MFWLDWQAVGAERGREEVCQLRSKLWLIVVPLPRKQLLLHQPRHGQRRVEMLVIEDDSPTYHSKQHIIPQTPTTAQLQRRHMRDHLTRKKACH
mgnify:CR=1 FL=1